MTNIYRDRARLYLRMAADDYARAGSLTLDPEATVVATLLRHILSLQGHPPLLSALCNTAARATAVAAARAAEEKP